MRADRDHRIEPSVLKLASPPPSRPLTLFIPILGRRLPSKPPLVTPRAPPPRASAPTRPHDEFLLPSARPAVVLVVVPREGNAPRPRRRRRRVDGTRTPPLRRRRRRWTKHYGRGHSFVFLSLNAVGRGRRRRRGVPNARGDGSDRDRVAGAASRLRSGSVPAQTPSDDQRLVQGVARVPLRVFHVVGHPRVAHAVPARPPPRRGRGSGGAGGRGG